MAAVQEEANSDTVRVNYKNKLGTTPCKYGVVSKAAHLLAAFQGSLWLAGSRRHSAMNTVSMLTTR